ncbi:hypothetical protein DLAC_01003 [Tieghemostelium lacteum]|uniref:Uncharacterized protein n=1 Tax=Tieghemostelium lacteum TaxID=361077 RepID=A0A152A814_TIELA|nr:hypothetical protein DLAC_01003 [Tieghemostelium lacteum]|eukprot:KYR02187.1 hypothetical protein DLAC_01003 [Tieghemostelium lacteum]
MKSQNISNNKLEILEKEKEFVEPKVDFVKISFDRLKNRFISVKEFIEEIMSSIGDNIHSLLNKGEYAKNISNLKIRSKEFPDGGTDEDLKIRWEAFDSAIDKHFKNDSKHYKEFARTIVRDREGFDSDKSQDGKFYRSFIAKTWNGTLKEYIIGSFSLEQSILVYIISYELNLHLSIPFSTSIFGNSQEYVNLSINNMIGNIQDKIKKECKDFILVQDKTKLKLALEEVLLENKQIPCKVEN